MEEKITRPVADASRDDTPMPEDRYINRKQLRVLIPASDMTLWRWQRDPVVAFPPPVKLGPGARNLVDKQTGERRLVRIASNIGVSGGGFEYELYEAPLPD